MKHLVGLHTHAQARDPITQKVDVGTILLGRGVRFIPTGLKLFILLKYARIDNGGKSQ